MPIYEYRCSACGFEKDALQKMADAPLVTCPSCGKFALVKLVSAAGFQLKGSGWYATDFKGNGSAKAAADKSKPAGAAEGSNGAESESGTSKSAESGTSKSAESGGSKPADSGSSKAESAKAPSSPTPGAGD